MLLFRPLLLLIFSITTVFATSWDDVLADCKKCDAIAKQLTASVNAYTGTGSQFLTINSQEQQLINCLKQWATDANNATPAPTVAQIQAIFDCFCKTFYATTQALVNAFKNKRTIFANNGLKATIKNYFTNLKAAYDTVADALIAKSPNQSFKTNFQNCKTTFDTLFNSAISYFT